MKRSGKIAVVLHIIDEAYDRPAWHGPNLRGSIRGLTEREAAWRPGPGRHSIREIVVHAAYWKYAVRRRILGGKRGSFAMSGSNWFSRPDRKSGGTWRDDVALLDEQHRTLRAAIAALRDADLAKKPLGSRVTTLRLVAGSAAHDFYHAGQIRLLKRLRAGR